MSGHAVGSRINASLEIKRGNALYCLIVGNDLAAITSDKTADSIEIRVLRHLVIGGILVGRTLGCGGILHSLIRVGNLSHEVRAGDHHHIKCDRIDPHLGVISFKVNIFSAYSHLVSDSY